MILSQVLVSNHILGQLSLSEVRLSIAEFVKTTQLVFLLHGPAEGDILNNHKC